MIHEMKLQEKYFNYIKDGEKRIEMRLYDEKRQQISLGDTIRFFKYPDLKESIDTVVIGLLRYNNFESLVNDFDIAILGDKDLTKKDLIQDLDNIYSQKEQNKYGVLGIRLELKK